MPLTLRPATPADLPALHPVIERAYRGDSARQGWTHEADLLDDTRTDAGALVAILADPAERLLIAVEDNAILGCVQVSDRGGGRAYLGLLCIEPMRQAGGLGRQLIAAAEETARTAFGATMIEMTVIDRRVELIAYYERRGYVRTGETRDFPVPVDPPLYMTVLAKPLR
ncbi:GNAT family N-acetyltransferase [Sphingomonas hengshuiensis]|uniref:GCN5 family acetyltransferase n=1 Tax=Sphingomonas hengshuiensis TaxID=1609977 RepID=A0A7U4LEK0_9SPHN|nr:GNAT family N-acetyltransferase [Sphingomonas hengshuiensis]AJP71574.1 GCN5 family acetyltransferase [Sphingomonas hengshuiensis]